MLNEGNQSGSTAIDVVAYSVDKKELKVIYVLERYTVDGNGDKHWIQDLLWVEENTVAVDETAAEIACSSANPIPGVS